MTAKHGLMFGNKGRRKKVEFFTDKFYRNSVAASLKGAGFRVRKFERKPAIKKGTFF